MLKRKEKATQVAHISVTALEPLEDKKEESIQIFEDIIGRVQQKFPKVVSNLWESVWTKGGDLAFRMDTFYTPENWEMMKQQVRQDSATFSMADSDMIRKGRKDQKPDFVFIVDIADRPRGISTRSLYGMNMSVNRGIYETCFEDDYVELFRHMAKVTGAVTGHMDYLDEGIGWGGGIFPPIYSRLSETTLEESAELWDRRVPGYYWGLLLTQWHIAALGGIEAVKKNAPVYLVKEWEIGGKPALYLQLTEDIFHITREQRIAYKEYLKPLMPEIDFVKAAWEKQFYGNRRIGIAVFTEEEQRKIDELAALPKEELKEMARVVYDRERNRED